ncbi:MAG: DegV family protein [Clostridia bacterium]|nr:DegV family protein [Clostridia bacterium]
MKEKDYVILTDSTTDISQDIADELGVKIWPMQFELDGLTYRNFPDEREMKSEEFYNTMRNGKMPKTSQINVADFCEYFSEHLDKGLDILYICFSSGLSGTYNNSLLAIEELKEKYPDRRIVSVDSLAASTGEGLLVYLAGQHKKQGMGLEELAKWVEDNRLHLCHWFTVDDLHHLKRGGRVSAATAIVGSALNIKPVLHVDDEGHLINMSKVRGRKASINAMVDQMVETYTNQYDTVMIGQGDCRDDAEYLAGEVKKRVKGVKKVVICNIGPVIGAHAGPGVLALFFYGDHR